MAPGGVPVIDVGGLRDGDAERSLGVAGEIGRAARETGFFSIVNHGVSDVLIGAAFASAQRFFHQPDVYKEAVALDKSPHYRGYARLGAERLDPNLPGDVKESFNIGVELAADDPDLLAGSRFRGPNQWPDQPGFRATALRYFAALNALAIDVQRGIAIDLGLAPDFFVPSYDRPLTVLRFLRYPPHPGTFDGTLYGAGAHTDYGILTLLAQDDAGGLEVRRRDGEWLPVAPIPGAFVCNIGDALMRWSNDTYVSTPHRVVNRAPRERYSIAFFADPNPDALIACLPTCADADNPPRYPPIAYADYQQERYDATYGAASA